MSKDKLNKIQMKEKFVAFQNAWDDLNVAWQDTGTGKFCEDYPFNECFNELRCNVHDWTETCIKNLGIKTFENMIESREVVDVGIFEDRSDQETGYTQDCTAFVYFEHYYIIMGKDSHFHLQLMNYEYSSDKLRKMEKLLWRDFLNEEINC